MISITNLWCGKKDRNFDLRYNKPRNIDDIKPVVVWNSTRRCNLKCIHCYSSSENKSYDGELNTDEAKQLITDLSLFGSPCLLISGGEPLMRDDIFELLDYAKDQKLPVALSTNGTLITDDIARQLKSSDLRYVGISLDGIAETNDRFRGKVGAFDKALSAFKTLRNHDIKCGLRYTMTRENLNSLKHIFELVEEYSIGRVCFYHFVPAGRSSEALELAPDRVDIRRALDMIIDWSEDLLSRHIDTEVLTVDNHADAIYLYLRSQNSPSPQPSPQRGEGEAFTHPQGGEGEAFTHPQRGEGETPPLPFGKGDRKVLPPLPFGERVVVYPEQSRGVRGREILELVRGNGGAKFSSGVGICCVDNIGNIHPDQFWSDCIFGNIRDKKFSEIWTNPTNEIHIGLRNRLHLIKGKCSRCKWLEQCGGSLRSRAYAYTGDPWEADPGCYLSESEILPLTPPKTRRAG